MIHINMSGTAIFLFIIFLLLKVFHVVTWSWWIVTLPLWIGFAIWGVITLFALLMMLITKK